MWGFHCDALQASEKGVPARRFKNDSARRRERRHDRSEPSIGSDGLCRGGWARAQSRQARWSARADGPTNQPLGEGRTVS